MAKRILYFNECPAAHAAPQYALAEKLNEIITLVNQLAEEVEEIAKLVNNLGATRLTGRQYTNPCLTP